MKPKFFLILLLYIISRISYGQNEDSLPYKKFNYFKINSLAFASSSLSMFLERFNNSGDSYQIGYFTSITDDLFDLTFQGVNADLKFAIDKQDNNIIYLGPFVRWFKYESKVDPEILIYSVFYRKIKFQISNFKLF